MLKVFSFFKIKVQFDSDEFTDVFIQCNCSNKPVTQERSEAVMTDILPVFIKSVVFHNVGLSWMIETK